jgi:RND family efflux transporter MFP subunit
MKTEIAHRSLTFLLRVAETWMLFLPMVAGCTGSSAAEGQEKIERVRQQPADSTVLNAVRVRVAPVVIATFQGGATLTGLAKPGKRATVAAEVPGRLVKNRCTVGCRVKKNEPIYRVDTSDIRLQVRQAAENLDARKTDAEFSTRELARTEKLVMGEVQSEQTLTKSRYERDRAIHGMKAAETALSLARQSLRDAVIRAPFSGTIAECLAERGDYVGPGTPVFKIVDLSEVRVEVGIPAALIATLRSIAHAKVEIEAPGGLARDATLVETSPSPNPLSGTYPARFALQNEDGAVLEGMTAQIVLTGEPREVLAVPREAVFRVEGEPRVYTVGENRATERSVLLGTEENGEVEITSGLKRGERVVVDGMFSLTDGRPVMVEQREEEK